LLLTFRRSKRKKVFCVCCGVAFVRHCNVYDSRFIWFENQEQLWYYKKFEPPAHLHIGKDNVIVHEECFAKFYNPLLVSGVAEFNPSRQLLNDEEVGFISEFFLKCSRLNKATGTIPTHNAELKQISGGQLQMELFRHDCSRRAIVFSCFSSTEEEQAAG
jgi:hypothetical protein